MAVFLQTRPTGNNFLLKDGLMRSCDCREPSCHVISNLSSKVAVKLNSEAYIPLQRKLPCIGASRRAISPT